MADTRTKAYFDHKPGYGISKKRLASITRLAGDVTEKSVLDIGCGDGRLGAHLKTRGAARVVGCDIAAIAVAAATEQLDAAFVYDVTDGNLAELAGEQFDVVIATELIEHLFTPAELLREVQTVLKPGGIFVVTTPNFLVWTNRVRMLCGQFAYTKTGLLDESHVYFFTYRTLHQLLAAEGFQVIAEDNVYHRRIPRWLAKLIPTASVFQMVFACKKVSS